MLAWSSRNQTLLEYLYPKEDAGGNIKSRWLALLPGCRIEPLGCWCFHVAGSMVKALNPHGARRCAPKDRLIDCTSRDSGFSIKVRKNCSCFAQDPTPTASPCLFGDMRPAKLLAIIAACRAAGVSHIIEQGRYGGLSAYIYALHGFRVTSIELLPLSEVSTALSTLAPSVTMIDADGRQATVAAVASAAATGERLAVIFDGEKRQTAYETFRLIKPRVALAAFDDTNLDDGEFPRMLHAANEDAWHTWDCAFMAKHGDARPLAGLSAQLQAATQRALRRVPPGASEQMMRTGQLDESGRLIFHGGMENLARFHTTLVRGGASWG